MKLPAAIKQDLTENFSIDMKALEEAHEEVTPVSVRLNPLKPLAGFDPGERIGWASSACYLPERPVFTIDPLFHAGCYYVQEASSMFVEEAVRQCVDLTEKVVALDACAAPGGKSTLLASLLSEESLLVSNEVISTRTPVLVHNMAKWGTNNSIVTQNDPHDFDRLPGFFDLMVVDAPCSGSGLFRKQKDAIGHWSEENVRHCSLRQQRILDDLLPGLKENGVLIYSTCSYSTEENENMSDYLCEKFSLQSIRLQLKAEWKITETTSAQHKAFGYRFFPHLTKGEGFFLACFKKVSPQEKAEKGINIKNKIFNPLTSEEEKALNMIAGKNNTAAVKFFSDICGYPARLHDEMNSLAAALRIKKMPVHFGQLKGKDFIPHAYAAYQPVLSLPKIDVDMETALKYLRKQPFAVMSGQKGFELLTYKEQGLGWLKNLGSRINNYYPPEWRILKEIF